MNKWNIYADIPDVDAYLKKIGMSRPEHLNKAYLDQLVCAHQTMIPWGNLDVCCLKLDVSMEIPDIFDKVIVRGREAFCVELNSLFYSLLKALGYDIYACLAKVVEGLAPHVVGHRGTIVRLDKKEYYCDVGFGGPMPAGAIELTDGVKQHFKEDDYVMTEEPYLWWALDRLSDTGEKIPMIKLQQLPMDPVDFIPISHYTCCHTQREFNHFTDELLMNIRTEDGYASITNTVLKVRKGDVTTATELHNEEELIDALRTIFRANENVGDVIRGNVGFLFAE